MKIKADMQHEGKQLGSGYDLKVKDLGAKTSWTKHGNGQTKHR
jgi:hypothetical protein